MDRLLGDIIAIVLTLLALIGFTYTGYNGFQSYKTGVVVNDVTQMAANARTGFSQGNSDCASFTTTNVPTMISNGAFPTDIVRGNTIVDPWGSPVTLASTNNAS